LFSTVAFYISRPANDLENHEQGVALGWATLGRGWRTA
jgi:hypothetical protein